MICTEEHYLNKNVYTRTLDFTVVYNDTGMYTREALEREISSDVRTPMGAINDR